MRKKNGKKLFENRFNNNFNLVYDPEGEIVKKNMGKHKYLISEL